MIARLALVATLAATTCACSGVCEGACQQQYSECLRHAPPGAARNDCADRLSTCTAQCRETDRR